MITRTLIRRTVFATMVMACAGIAFAGDHTDSTALTVVSSDVIYFETTGEHAQLQLTISAPDGTVTRRVFDGWDIPSFEVFDAQGDAIMDGIYAFEIWATPQINRAKNNDGNRIAIPEEQVPMIHSGHFRVSQGQFVLPGTEEFQPVKSEPTVIRTVNKDDETPGGGPIDADEPGEDQVILDDLIVDGSACVGFDCVNGESFGFDTLRLKENNLRIKFDDTSTTGSFPNNDWQITANDSANGGANKFSIDDISGGRTPFTIEALAPSHSLYVDDGGRVGLGTSTPVVELHVVNGDSPTLRLEQNGSSGFTPQTWDVAGNETNFFVRDATNGSTLPLRIRPGADSNSIFVDVDNDIGMLTASPESSLHVRRTDATAKILIEDASASTDFLTMFEMRRGSSTGGMAFRLANSDTTIDFNNTGGEFRINFDDADNFELALDADGNLEIDGALTMPAGKTIPDYVFDSSYALMPISELAIFVQQEKHLPGVPSQSEIAKNGNRIDVGDMQMRMLEKIEELTLYTLQQQAVINELQKRLESIEQSE